MYFEEDTSISLGLVCKVLYLAFSIVLVSNSWSHLGFDRHVSVGLRKTYAT